MTSPRIIVATLLTSFAQAGQDSPEPDEPWARIRSFMEQDTGDASAEFSKYLDSLTAQQMLLAARQACEEVARRSEEMHDMPPAQVAQIYVATCLHGYFNKCRVDEGAARLLAVVEDSGESPFLRSAIISWMWKEPKTRLQESFQGYVSANAHSTYATLQKILVDKHEDTLVRGETMAALARNLSDHIDRIILADANVRAAVNEECENTDDVIRAVDLVRSGEVELTQDTRSTLKVVEERAMAYVAQLGAILADRDNEPEALRKQARRRLESSRRSVLSGLDEHVEKALRRAER